MANIRPIGHHPTPPERQYRISVRPYCQSRHGRCLETFLHNRKTFPIFQIHPFTREDLIRFSQLTNRDTVQKPVSPLGKFTCRLGLFQTSTIQSLTFWFLESIDFDVTHPERLCRHLLLRLITAHSCVRLTLRGLKTRLGLASIHRIWVETSVFWFLATSPPRAQLLTILLSRLYLPHIMATLKPPAIGDTPSNVYPHSTMAAALNADIQSLTTFKDMVQDATVKEVFESVIAILTLIRVRFSPQFLTSFPLIDDRTGRSR